MYNAPAIGFGQYGAISAKPQLAIQGDCIFHYGLDGVEAHSLVADLARLGDDALGQGASEALAAKLRTQIQPLHFAGARLQLVEGDAGGELPVALSK